MPNTIKATKSNIKTLIGNVPVYLKCPISNIIDVVQRVKLKKTAMLLPRTRCMFPATSQHKLYLADFSNLSFTFTCHRFSFVIRSVLHRLKLFPIGKLHTSGRTTWSCNGILNSSLMEMLNVYIVVSMHIQKYDLILFNSKLTLNKK